MSAEAGIGVLLVNLGTPEAPEPAAVRRYLGGLLSDPRVVEIPAILWQPILRGLILTTRPAKVAKAYREIWTDKGSPLAAISAGQAARLAETLRPSVMVDWAMRYGARPVEERVRAMVDAGCDRILIAPLYPQYCAATTATANDAAFRALARMRRQPALRTLPAWHDDPVYIAALRDSIEASLATLDFVPDCILASFHGMPQRTCELGDPYRDHCLGTARLLGEALGRPVEVSFQSRFGRAKWLEPATDTTLSAMPGRGVKKVAVVCPGFVADCLETLEEIAIRGRADFVAGGGERFAYIPCLNDSHTGVNLLHHVIARELEGWGTAP